MTPALKFDTTTLATYEDRIKALVLLGGLPARESGNPHAEKAAYHLALEDVTRYALQEAVKFILKGSLKHTFFPSPPELRLQCDKAMEWHVREADRIRRREQMERERIPERQEPTPESKARVAALMERFRQSSAEASRREAEEAERVEIRARYGMDAETLAGIKDQPVPSNFEQVGQAARK